MNDEYISREAVVRYLKGYSEKECNSNSPYGMITSSVLNKAERALSEMPAADVQPVKHGKWEISSDGYYPYCSECKSRADGKLTKYCGECGARMDGGDKDDS